jgi:hypothetical protein
MNTNLSNIDYKKIIMDQIEKLQSTLDDEHEVAMELNSFGKSFFTKITDIEFTAPDMITIHGLSGGKKPVALMQHVSRLRLLFIPVKKSYWEKN